MTSPEPGYRVEIIQPTRPRKRVLWPWFVAGWFVLALLALTGGAVAGS